MAKATKHIHIKTVIKPVTTEVPYFKLELDEQEVNVLIAILASIGGDMSDSYRGISEDIYDALCESTGKYCSSEDIKQIINKINSKRRTIYFEDGF